jgi:hypothetical protein
MDFKLKGGLPGMPGIPQIPSQLPMLLLVLGGGAIGLGLLVLFNPVLLVWMVAGVFILIGVLLVLTGLRAKKMLG